MQNRAIYHFFQIHSWNLILAPCCWQKCFDYLLNTFYAANSLAISGGLWSLSNLPFREVATAAATTAEVVPFASTKTSVNNNNDDDGGSKKVAINPAVSSFNPSTFPSLTRSLTLTFSFWHSTRKSIFNYVVNANKLIWRSPDFGARTSTHRRQSHCQTDWQCWWQW